MYSILYVDRWVGGGITCHVIVALLTIIIMYYILYRVPKEKKGPLDKFWKIRDSEGFILNNDGTRSAVVHQWDRFYDEIVPFLDSKLYPK